MPDIAELGFYFDPSRGAVDWQGPDTVVTANPEWLVREPQTVTRSLSALPDLAAHVWVATSGTSSRVPGHIRWVALSKAAFLASARSVNAHLQSLRADVWAHALPVFHVGGLGILARSALSGAKVVPGVAGRWDAWRFRQRVEQARATLTALVPAQVHDLVNGRLRAPESLRAVIVGGGHLDPELCGDARALGWPCLPSYGLTETCSQVATAAPESALSRDCARPLPILPHADVRQDEEQRLVVRAESLLTCYAELTDDGVRVWDPKRAGWLETEDLGRVTADGVEVFGRVSESVKVLGELVSLPHVEQAARRWAAAERDLQGASPDLAVIAPAHERLGHELTLVLASSDRARLEPLTESVLWPSLLAFASDALMPFERIRRVAWVDRIPRTALGKVQRQLLACQVGLETRPHPAGNRELLEP